MKCGRSAKPSQGARFSANIRISVGTLLLVASLALVANEPFAQNLGADWRSQSDLRAALFDGRPSANLRYRYEFVSEDGRPRDAHAHTVRARLGYETGPLFGFRAMIEGEALTHIGARRFNDTVDPDTRFPIVADPDDFGLNQYWIASTHVPSTEVKLGRQRVTFDNHRFVGNVGFRQNEQTFDALRVSSGPLSELSVDYAYVYLVDRLFGEDSPVGDFETNSHLVRAAYRVSQVGLLTGYAYLLDFDEAPALSSRTFGLRLKGQRGLDENWRVLYAGEFAWQQDHANNPNHDDFAYYLAEAGLSYSVSSFMLGYEVLSGNDRRAFQAPLGTLHAFQGTADLFLTTPPGGVRDLYIRLRHGLSGPMWLKGTGLTATLHRFAAEQGGRHLGDEVDLALTYPVHERVSLGVEGAYYDAARFGSDTTKVWLSLTVTY